MEFLHRFFEVFIPLLVAIDPIGLVPVFLSVTPQLSPERRRRVIFDAVAAGLVICLVFMFLGDAIFRFLGINASDFKIAGGVILLVLAVLDLLITGKPAVHEGEMVGIVPLATPLIAGPATLTTTLVLVTNPAYRYGWTMLGLAVNFAILLVALLGSGLVARVLGMNALRAFSKLVMVLLAALAVNFIRSGITELIRGLP